MTTSLPDIDSWTEFMSAREIPVLRQTVRAIAAARMRAEHINAHEVSVIILRDPLMTAQVLRFCARNRGRRQWQDLSTVKHAVMMLGVEPFFHHFTRFDIIEDRLKPQPQALLGLLQIVRRSQRAARYAQDWATWRCDLNNEEVAVSALLHGLAEMMVWCFAPEQALAIQKLKKDNPALHCAAAQTAVLGFLLSDLQAALCRNWELPELLSSLMEDSQHERPRVQNVKLAVDLARHSANGWDNPGLPDDFRTIAALMHIDDDTLKSRLGLSNSDQPKLAHDV